MIRASVQAMQGYLPGEQPDDPAVVKLNTNENPYPVPDAVMATLRAVPAEALRRYPDPLCRPLRARLAERHGCDPSQIIVANGSDEILALCTRAFVENDGAIGRFEPTYSLYETLIAIRGVNDMAIPLRPDFDWPIDDALAQLAKEPACGLFFFANPNAPTGRFCAPDAVRRFASEFDGVVLIDEAYVDFAEADCTALVREMPNVIVSRTMSKSCSLAGARLGYALGDASLIEALMKIKDSYNVNVLTQRVGMAILDADDAVRANIQRIKATRTRLTRDLTARGYAVTPSQANFIWVRPAGIDAEALYAALKSRGVLIRFFPGPRTGEYVRISVGTDTDRERLLEELDRIAGS